MFQVIKRGKYTIYKLEYSDLHYVKSFIENQYFKLPNKDFFIMDDLDTEFSNILLKEGLAYAVIQNNKIISLQALDLNQDNLNFIKEIIPFNCKKRKVAEMGWSLTHHKYRNRGLCQLLIKELEQTTALKNDSIIYFTTVHPDNFVALKTYLKSGFVGIAFQIHYNLPRIVLTKSSDFRHLEGNCQKRKSLDSICEMFNHGSILIGIDCLNGNILYYFTEPQK